MKLLRPGNSLLPLALLSVLATGLTFAQPAFWLTGRWICLGLLALYVIVAARARARVSPLVALVTTVYVVWCVATVGWSDVPSLSLAKSAALVMVSFAALLAGYQWMFTHDRWQSLSFLWPWAALSLAAGLIPGNPAQFGSDDFSLYAGSTANPNTLGAMIAMSLPVVILRVYKVQVERERRFIWLAVLAVFLVILHLTASRSAYLILLGILAGFMISIRMQRRMVVMARLVWAVLLVAAVAPAASGSWIQRNIYKQSDAGAGTGILDSRTRVWEESYEGALAGGWAGLGYGVSAGSDAALFSSMFTTAGYGREKGNSQLAVIEETGVIGLGLYTVLIAVLLRTLFRGLSALRNEHKVALGLVIGTLLGLLAQSTVEGWWVAPGAPEFVFFWSVAGAGLGLARRARVPALRRFPVEMPQAIRRRAIS